MSGLDNLRRALEELKAEDEIRAEDVLKAEEEQITEEEQTTEEEQPPETDLQPLADAGQEYYELVLKHNGDAKAARQEFVQNRMARRRLRLSSAPPSDEGLSPDPANAE